MRNLFLTLLILLIGFQSYSQSDKSSYLGINLLGLPSSTLNVNYSVESFPFLTPVVDAGYTLGIYNADLIGYLLTSHCKCDDGYDLEMPSGGYIKLGGYLNLRKDMDKSRFFHLGLFVTHAMVHEKGIYSPPPYESEYAVKHTVFVSGLSASLGYEFNWGKRLKSGIDYQISLPSNKYNDLYSYETFIPGMGYSGGGERWFPMLIWNVRYRL